MSSFQQIVFLHILKTAGQSVMKVLELNYPEKDRLFANKDKIVDMERDVLQKYKIIYGHNFYNIYQLLGEKPVYFTFLRDPIERTLSHYAYLRRAGYYPPVLSQTVEEFVSDPGTKPYIANYQTRWLASESLKEPARHDEPGILDLAKERLHEFAFVGIVEEFERSMETMAYVFDWKLPRQIPVINVGKSERPKNEELSARSLELIRSANNLDFELYEYGCEILKSHSRNSFSNH